MHEVSIAEGLLATAVNECKKSGYGKIEKVSIKIGKASGVMPEALLFAFDAMKPDTIASEAVLDIEEVPLAGICLYCEKNFETEDSYLLCCPHCESSSFRVISGRELDITELEVF
ncbi:MAG: hydrogenase maturation nickel metallochaperone HypA [Nitrospirae bacterium]|nr:hydrogenase maturation nickel metallochaperone HypA [Nitrospirota bacterium]